MKTLKQSISFRNVTGIMPTMCDISVTNIATTHGSTTTQSTDFGHDFM